MPRRSCRQSRSGWNIGATVGSEWPKLGEADDRFDRRRLRLAKSQLRHAAIGDGRKRPARFIAGIPFCDVTLFPENPEGRGGVAPGHWKTAHACLSCRRQA